LRRLAALAGVLLVAGSSAVAFAASGPPVIKERFTRLPCPAKQKTTIDMEACQEKALLDTDKQINGTVKAIWKQLPVHGRASFAAGERSWLAYRRSSCAAEASAYAGGSVEPVVYAACAMARDKTHLDDLGTMLSHLLSH